MEFLGGNTSLMCILLFFIGGVGWGAFFFIFHNRNVELWGDVIFFRIVPFFLLSNQ